MTELQKSEQTPPSEKTNKPGAIIGGAILGASIGGPAGALAGGVIGGFLSVLFEDKSKSNNQNGGN